MPRFDGSEGGCKLDAYYINDHVGIPHIYHYVSFTEEVMSQLSFSSSFFYVKPAAAAAMRLMLQLNNVRFQ
jgi:hypothetical protein